MAEQNSFRKMTNEKVIIRSDAEKIDYFMIFPEPGFNPAGRTEEDDENDEQLYRFICEHGVFALPQWEVRPRDEGGVWIVDCHRRHKQTGRAIKNGMLKPDAKTGKYLVPIKQFQGNDIKRLYRIGTSNKKKDLTPMNWSELCVRARDVYQQSIKEIADGFQISVSSVNNYLMLASANNDVHQMVKSGAVSASTAVKLQREAGEKAGPILKEALAQAKGKGKEKVMPTDLKPRQGPSRRDLAIAEAIRFAILEPLRDTISGEQYDAMLDLDVAAIITAEVK